MTLVPLRPLRRPSPRQRLRRVPAMVARLPGTCRREAAYTVRGAAVTFGAWQRWCRCDDDARRLDRADKHTEGAALTLANRRANNRKITGAGAVAVTGGWVWLGVAWPDLAVALIVLAVGILDLIGRHAREPLGVEKGRRSPFREGESLRSVVASVRDYAQHSKAKVTVTGAAYDGDDGIALDVRHDGELSAEFLAGLERWLRTYRGAVHAAEDPTARGGSRVTVSWRDRLAVSAPPPLLSPDSRRGTEPAVVGVSANGDPAVIDRWRTNVLLVGQPGSGKSSAGWVLLDADTANPDIRVVGIDLRGGGGPLLNAWGDLVEEMATDVAQAERLLDELLDEARARTSMLGARSRPGARHPGPENWTPADGRQWVLYIEELPLLAGEKGLVGRYAELLRIGRAPAVVSVALAQDMAKETVGSTAFRKHVMTSVLFASSADDVTNLFGRGALAAGWRSDLLMPADGINPNDAGRCYIRSPRYPAPMQHRWYRLDDAATDIHPRVHARLAARGQARPDAGEVLDAEVLSPLQIAVGVVFDTEHADWLPTKVLLARLAEDGIDADAKTLAKELSGERSRRKWGGLPQVWGYGRDAI